MITLDLKKTKLESISSLQIKDEFATEMIFDDSMIVLSKEQMEFIKEHCDIHFTEYGGRQEDFEKYIKQLEPPGLDRSKSRHYQEVQRLSYSLVRYLRMNDDKNEHVNQGNWNLTYLIENMKQKDHYFITSQLMKRIPLNHLQKILDEDFTDSSRHYLRVHSPPREGAPETITKEEVEKYMAKHIPAYIGFGFAMASILSFGTYLFFG